MPPPYPASQIGTLYRRDERTLTEKYGKFGGPYFMLEISDQQDNVLFSAESHAVDGNYDLDGLIVSDVQWDENDCQSDMMTLTVNNVDMEIHDSRLFAEGNSIDLWMGYDGHQPEYMGRGIVVTVEPEFSRDGIPKLSITCYDIAHFMMEEGKAEIQTEGTAWFERHSVPADGDGNDPNPAILTNHLSDNDSEIAQRDAEARAAGAAPGSIPSASVSGAAPNTDIGNTAISVIDTPDSPPTESTAQPRNRTSIRQARPNRRRRNRGKVWRNLRDDEIVAAIFESYGIVPYVEATNQRARARRETTTIQGEDTIITNNRRDTTRQRDNDQRDAERLNAPPGTVPASTVDGANNTDDIHNEEIRAIVIEGEERQVTTETGGRRLVQKAGTSDWDFIKKLAKNHANIVFVFYDYNSNQWIGYWGSPNNVPQHVSYTFDYNNGDDTTLGSFKPKISMRGQKTEIDLIYTDPVVRRQQRLRVSMENISNYTQEFRGPDATSVIDEPIGNGPEVVLSIHGQRVAVTANRRFTSMDDAKRWLMSFWYRHASEFCEAEGDCVIGIPEIRCRHRHTIRGFGRYDGKYFFTKTSHKMGSGNVYSTSFSMYRLSDMLEGVPDQETSGTSVESNDMGSIPAAARDVVRRWQEALSSR